MKSENTEVAVLGKIIEVDQEDSEQPYNVLLSTGDMVWVGEEDLFNSHKNY